MSIKPFYANNLRSRFHELWAQTENVTRYSDSFRGEVLDLIVQTEQ